jgi:hypothetical protein
VKVPRLVTAGLVALGLLGVGCPCPSGPEVVHVRSLQLLGDSAGAGALGEAGLDRAAVEDAVRSALASAGFQIGDGRCPHAVGIDIAALRLAPGGSVGPRAELALEVVLRPAEDGPAPHSEVGSASVPLAAFGNRPRDAWKRALADASQRAATGLAAALRAEAKTVDGLVADLSAKDPRVREEAVRVLGERKSRQAVPALIDRLGKEDARVVLRIVAALAQIGDERAVPALIDLGHESDPATSLSLVRFIADIGGAEAEGYLLTLASGHPDPRVRDAAREALDELARRAKDAPVAARSAKMPAP